MFVNFDGKKELIVEYELFYIHEVRAEHLEDFNVQINEQMKEYLGEKLLNILTSNFTTTNKESLIISKISIMGTFKKYFDYTMFLLDWGVPYLILEGITDDYKKIKEKALKLKKYKFD